MGKTVERIVNAERVEDLITVFGSFDENIKRIEEALGVQVINRGTDLRILGDEEMADKAARTLEGLLTLAAKGEVIDEQRVCYLINLVNEGNDQQVAQMTKDVVCITAKGKPIKAKTVGQQAYMKAIQKNTVTIGVGPAGTGKTYLAVAAAVAAFREHTVNRIILTRLGFGSKIVITGDVTQIDLPEDKTSGLKDAIRVLDGVKDIAICRLTASDVVRHALVQQIINAYEKADNQREKKQELKRPARQFGGRYQRKQ